MAPCRFLCSLMVFSMTVSLGLTNGHVTSPETLFDPAPRENVSSTTETVGVDAQSSEKTTPVAINSDVYVFGENVTNRFLAHSVTDFVCESNYFCNKTLVGDEHLCSFECTSCRCDEMCHIFGDCCLDVLFRDSPTVPSSAIDYVSCLNGAWTRWGAADGAMMITRCPSQHTNQNETVKMCHDPDIRDKSQATPVSGVAQGITYRNKYCALCHGVLDVDSWRHTVDCRNLTDLSGVKTSEDLWELVLKVESLCEIVTNPPPGVPLRNCSVAPMDRCNMTGAWLSYDPRVEALCGVYNHTVRYYGPWATFVSYRNVFCAVCNGIELTKKIQCNPASSGGLPHPMSVLLAFNPPPTPSARVLNRAPTDCIMGQTYDPVSMKCRTIECPELRVLEDGECQIPFTSTSGLGFKFDVVLNQLNGSEDFLTYFNPIDYWNVLKENLIDFHPFIVSSLISTFLKRQEMQLSLQPDKILIHVEIITLTEKRLQFLEETLLKLMSLEQTYTWPGGDVSLSSSAEFCPEEILASNVMMSEIEMRQKTTSLNPRCMFSLCRPTMATVGPGCPFLQYNLSRDNVTFNEETSSLTINNSTMIKVNRSQIVRCGEALRICLDVISEIRRQLAVENPVQAWAPFAKVTPVQNVPLSIVSLVCTTLSLFCLVLTFSTYTCIKRLKTIPGMNTSALVFHIFWSQLLFLVGISRTENPTVCKAFGVLTHLFWIATFCWTAASAYHMYRVFTNLRPMPSTGKTDVSGFLRYCLFCILTPTCVVGGCTGYYLIRSDGIDIGYGGDVCFITDAIGIGVFFAAPLIITLIANAIFFIQTVLAIRSVPDMKDLANVTNKHYVYIYIKLAALFGFTWVFGIMAEILRSDILRYAFIVLTGSQGVFIFVAYCVNKRTLNVVKSVICGNRDASTTDGSNPSKHTNKAVHTGST